MKTDLAAPFHARTSMNAETTIKIPRKRLATRNPSRTWVLSASTWMPKKQRVTIHPPCQACHQVPKVDMMLKRPMTNTSAPPKERNPCVHTMLHSGGLVPHPLQNHHKTLITLLLHRRLHDCWVGVTLLRHGSMAERSAMGRSVNKWRVPLSPVDQVWLRPRCAVVAVCPVSVCSVAADAHPPFHPRPTSCRHQRCHHITSP